MIERMDMAVGKVLRTFLEAAGSVQSEQQILDGVSLMPLLKEENMKQRSLFWYFPVYLEPYKGIRKVWRQTPVNVIRNGDWKLLGFFEDNHVELYNLAEDIGETKDFSGIETGKVKELLGELRQWRTSLHAPVPTERNPEFNPVFFREALERISARSK